MLHGLECAESHHVLESGGALEPGDSNREPLFDAKVVRVPSYNLFPEAD